MKIENDENSYVQEQLEYQNRWKKYMLPLILLISAVIVAIMVFKPFTKDQPVEKPKTVKKAEKVDYITHADEQRTNIAGGYVNVIKEYDESKPVTGEQRIIEKPSEKQPEADSNEAKAFKESFTKDLSKINIGQLMLFPKEVEKITAEVYESPLENADFTIVFLHDGNPFAYAHRYPNNESNYIQGADTDYYRNRITNQEAKDKFAEEQAKLLDENGELVETESETTEAVSTKATEKSR